MRPKSRDGLLAVLVFLRGLGEGLIARHHQSIERTYDLCSQTRVNCFTQTIDLDRDGRAS